MERAAEKIGRITPSGAITEFALPPGGGGPAITAGPDGNLWFTEEHDRIGRLTIPVDTSFFTVQPCRAFDSRNTSPFRAGSQASVPLVGQCGIPTGAKAVAVNLTVTAPTTAGNIRVFADGGAVPPTSTINYGAGQTRANNAVAPLGASGATALFVSQASGSVQVVIDVSGYFAPPVCTPDSTPAAPGLTFGPGPQLTWPPVPGATSYNVYVKPVAGQCGLLGPQSVTRSDQKLSNVSSPLDVSSFDHCETCYYVDASAVSGGCESRLRSDDGQPAPLSFSLLPCSP